MKVSAINTNSNQNFSGVRKIVQCGPIDKIGDFLVRPVRELTTRDGIDTTTKFFTPKGKFIGYHAVGKNGNVIGQRKFANGWEMQYWHDYTDREQQNRVLSVWIDLTKATNKKPAKRRLFYLLFIIKYLPYNSDILLPFYQLLKNILDKLLSDNLRDCLHIL